MLFSKNRIPQTPANKAVNRVLTYGLAFFILYAFYINKDNPVDNHKLQQSLNLTPIDWSKYVVITNLLTDEKATRKLDNGTLTLDLSKEDLSKLEDSAFTEQDTAAIYEIKVDQGLGALFSQAKH